MAYINPKGGKSMKKRSFEKKLVLNKFTVSNLSRHQLKLARGGDCPTLSLIIMFCNTQSGEESCKCPTNDQTAAGATCQATCLGSL